jgi:DNA-binding winged helix-turn-helix (wHTH) protein/tetratricopeptide (TPR) repeat protein
MGYDYQFGPFRLDVENECLWRGREQIILRPKSFAVLRYLVAQPRRLVARDEILEAIWEGIVVTDAVLTVCIGEIRQALGDDRHRPQYIETVHRRGYRFIGAISDVQAPDDTADTGRSRPTVARASPLSPQPSALNPVSLVGREAEIAQLEGWLEQAQRGARQVVLVAGEPGIGKTTLVNAFLARLPSQPPLWVARGQCIAHYGAGEAYLPVLDALGRLCREPGSGPLLGRLAQHAPTWLSQMPSLVSARELETLQHRVQAASRERMLRELSEAVDAITVEQPLVLVLEDLQWSDYATLDLVSWLAHRQESARLLVIGTYRPVELIVGDHPLQTVKQELLRHRQCVELPLELLTAADVAQYLSARFAVDVPLTGSFRALAQKIHHRTDGHPLFMVTVVDALVRQHSLVEQAGGWAVQGEVEKVALEVPESLQQLVEQQLRQLSPEEQRVLESGSVAGMQFSAAAVAAGLEERVEAVEGRCSTLARQGQFLQSSGVEEWPDGTVVGRYRFHHTLYRQVIYDRLPVGRCIQLHARIGARVEAGSRGQAAERAAELATHFELGLQHPKAVHYLQQAAEKALQRYAYQEAIALLRRGLAVLPKLPVSSERHTHELAIRITLGQVLNVTQGPGGPEVVCIYARAEELCREVGDVQQRIAVLRGLRRAAQGRGEPRRARPLAEEFLRLAQQRQNAALLIEGHMALGICLFYLGHVATAHTHLENGLAIDDVQRPQTHVFPSGQDLLVLGLAYDAMALWILGYPEQALQRSRRAIHLAEGAAQPWTLAMALGYAALVHVLRGDRQVGLERAEATIQLATEQAISPWVGRGMMLRGWALAEQGREVEGEAQMREGFTVWQASRQELGQPFWLALLGEGYARIGQVEEGLRVLAEATAMAHTRGLCVWEAELNRLQGELLSRRAFWQWSTPSAETFFRQALEIARGQQAKSLELRAAMSLSRLWQHQGNTKAARECLEERYHWFTEGFDTADLQKAMALRAALE